MTLGGGRRLQHDNMYANLMSILIIAVFSVSNACPHRARCTTRYKLQMAALLELMKHIEDQQQKRTDCVPMGVQLSPQQQRLPRVYLAGPEVFWPIDKQTTIVQAKKDICDLNGLVGIYPADTSINPVLPAATRARMIFAQNIHLIDGCQCIIANLTPFRGVSADAGTAFEIGYGVGKSMPVFGYTTSAKLYEQRVKSYRDSNVDDDKDTLIENFDKIENCMITESAYDISIPHSDIDSASLETFRQVVQDARVFFEQEMGYPPLKRMRTTSD